jgi:hypothetical protein
MVGAMWEKEQLPRKQSYWIVSEQYLPTYIRDSNNLI